MEEWKYSRNIVNVGTRWSGVVSFTAPGPFYLQGNRPRYPLCTRLAGVGGGRPQTRSSHYDEEKNFFPLPEIEPSFSVVQPLAYSLYQSLMEY
jgi:hypothetical protein